MRTSILTLQFALLCTVVTLNALPTTTKYQQPQPIAQLSLQPQQQQLQQHVVQVQPDNLNSNSDVTFAETAFPAAVSSGSKYFQYINVPAKDHYEHGHKRGNEHHFIERHEKGSPHAGEFKTKVRWGDKHGGYGEHYWDFNHAGHDDHDGDETQHYEQYEAAPAQSVRADAVASTSSLVAPQTSSSGGFRTQRSAKDDVEFISDESKAKLLAAGARVARHGGNYRRGENLRVAGRGSDDYFYDGDELNVGRQESVNYYDYS